MNSYHRPGLPGLFFRCACVLLLALAGCSARYDWREVRAVDLGYVVALPDKPQTVTHEVDYTGPGGPARLSMTMTSTGVGPTLFAVGAVRLPAPALTPAQLDNAIAWFRDALLRNVQGKLISSEPLAQSAPAGRQVRSARALRAQATAGRDGRPATLAARFMVVDDRLYQIVALGSDDELTANVLDTFFDSFRLI